MATAKGVQIALYGFRVLLVLMILLDCMVKSPLAGLAFVQPSTLFKAEALPAWRRATFR
jgi:hypothetical protein